MFLFPPRAEFPFLSEASEKSFEPFPPFPFLGDRRPHQAWISPPPTTTMLGRCLSKVFFGSIHLSDLGNFPLHPAHDSAVVYAPVLHFLIGGDLNDEDC